MMQNARINNLSSPPGTTYTGAKYLKVVLVAETKGVVVADMLRKSTEDSIKSMAMYRHELEKAVARSSSGRS
jgi:hypothetical protein